VTLVGFLEDSVQIDAWNFLFVIASKRPVDSNNSSVKWLCREGCDLVVNLTANQNREPKFIRGGLLSSGV
jgi:hypothetical protein